MDKKGFTLIELLAVVTIIVIITLIAIPNIFRGIKEQKTKISEANMKLLASATDIYIQNNKNYDNNYEANGSVYCIPIQTLIDNNVLETPIKNSNGAEIDYSSQIKATYQAEYNSFDYEIVDTCQEIKQYVNRPNLAENMIPVIYNEETNTWVKADKNSHWYNYSEKKWANAVLVKYQKGTEENSKNRYEYKEAPSGTPILESDILAYFTWIPRFKYQIFESDEPTEINIIFENIATPKSQGTVPGQWLTHPAFTYNNQELPGIWVGKYETANENNIPIIKSNKTPWTNIALGEAANISNEMTNENNIYGLNNSNTHLTQNNEWAAVAYLTNSQYGLNDKVNTNSSTTTGGTNSTTGNVYGIYDMSGLSKEFVTLQNENENSLGSALSETKSWYNETNTFITETNAYLTRGNTSIFNYLNSTVKNENISFRLTLINKNTISSEYIRPNIVSSGDGLYEAKGEPDRYIYRGANPNNYVWLDENGDEIKTSEEIYRIISYENDGTIKVIRKQALSEKKVWDSNNESSNRNNQQNTYCNYGNDYKGCNIWGNNTNTYLNNNLVNIFELKYYEDNITTSFSTNNNTGTVTENSTLNSTLNNTWLNSTELEKYISTHKFYAGAIYYFQNYNGGDKGIIKEKQEEQQYTWNGKIGLINVTEYAESSINPSCTSIYSNYFYNSSASGWPCGNSDYNWLATNINEWTITSTQYNLYSAWMIYNKAFRTSNTINSFYVRPTFYLKSSVVLDGEGTEQNPYTIVSY